MFKWLKEFLREKSICSYCKNGNCYDCLTYYPKFTCECRCNR